MKKLLSLITICMITTLCISINSSAATFGDNLTYDKVSNAEIATKTNRFFQEGTIHITNKRIPRINGTEIRSRCNRNIQTYRCS